MFPSLSAKRLFRNFRFLSSSVPRTIAERVDDLERMRHVDKYEIISFISQKFDSLDTKFDDLKRDFTGQIFDAGREFTSQLDEVKKYLTGQIDVVRTKFTEKIDNVRSEVDKLSKKTDSSKDELIKKIASNHEHISQALSGTFEMFCAQWLERDLILRGKCPDVVTNVHVPDPNHLVHPKSTSAKVDVLDSRNREVMECKVVLVEEDGKTKL